MTAAAESPDIRQLQGESLPTGDFPVGGKQEFRVFFVPAVHARIWQHACENLALEICGVLVGSWQRDAVGPFVTVSEFIRCDAAKSGFAEVTFTHDAWTKINAEMDTRLSGLKIVGWYHSHPDFGIFLSDRDVFIHQHFFSGAGQIAHVVDPVRKIDGVFAWQQGKPVLRPHFWVGERVLVTPERPSDHEPPGVVQAEPMPGPVAHARGSSAWIQTMITAAMFVCVFMLGFLIAGKRTDFERRLERQRDLEGVVAHFARAGVMRPGLDENLEKVAAVLRLVRKDVAGLSAAHARLAGDDAKAVSDQWSGVSGRLAAVEDGVQELRRFYVLAPDEQAIVQDLERRALDAIAQQSLRTGRRQPDEEEKPAAATEESPGPENRVRRDQRDSSRKEMAPSNAKTRDDSPKVEKSSTSSRE